MSLADPLRVLAAPRRQEILRLVWNQERSAGEITAAVTVSFGAVSQHLARLRTAGLVTVRRAGRHRYYQARKEALGGLREYFEALWSSALLDLKRIAEHAEHAEHAKQKELNTRNTRNTRSRRN